jgi:hypothetical protein
VTTFLAIHRQGLASGLDDKSFIKAYMVFSSDKKKGKTKNFALRPYKFLQP